MDLIKTRDIYTQNSQTINSKKHTLSQTLQREELRNILAQLFPALSCAGFLLCQPKAACWLLSLQLESEKVGSFLPGEGERNLSPAP